jgi:hypothetical protein
MHKVTCIYCKEVFDRDKEEFVQVSQRRYAHKKCAETNYIDKSQEEKDYDALEEYIKKLFNEDYLSARIRKQIKDMRAEYNYTYSGMLKTLIWWYEIKGNSIEKANEGIGIIPFVYKNACDYYYALYLANLVNTDYENYQTPVREIHIQSPRAEKKKKKKLFKFLEDEINGN